MIPFTLMAIIDNLVCLLVCFLRLFMIGWKKCCFLLCSDSFNYFDSPIFCPHMVKGRKRQCKQKWFFYSFRIPASWRTFLSKSHSCISTNKKVINFSKFLYMYYHYLKTFNSQLLTNSTFWCLHPLTIWGQYTCSSLRLGYQGRLEFCFWHIRC